MSTLKTNKITTTAGVEVYTAKAWVNFNGTGTVAIRAAGNVSSITDNGTGDYTVNFTTSMVDANYSLMGYVGLDSGVVDGNGAIVSNKSSTPSTLFTTTSARFKTMRVDSILIDAETCCISIFR